MTDIFYSKKLIQVVINHKFSPYTAVLQVFRKKRSRAKIMQVYAVPVCYHIWMGFPGILITAHAIF